MRLGSEREPRVGRDELPLDAGIDVGDPDPLRITLVGEEVHVARVGEVGDRDPCREIDDPIEVGRLGDQLARGRDEARGPHRSGCAR